MADKIPVKPIVDQNGVVIGLGEYAPGDTVPVAHGGTGADTAAGARTNLGAVAQTDFDSHVTAPNPHGTTAADIGAPSQAAFDNHVNNLNNPHNVTAAQIGAALASDLAAHEADTNNPHNVTAAQIGAALASDLTAHTGDTNNPHNVTAQQVGAIPASEKGAANGVPTLDAQGKIPAAQIPAAAIPRVFVVADAAERLALQAEEGDEAKQLDDGSWWIMDGTGTWLSRPSPGGNGDVVGPNTAADGGIATYDGTTGKVIKDSGVVIDPTQNVSGINSLTMGGSLSVGGNATIGGTVNGRQVQTDGANLDAHIADTSNPHNVTPAQVGNTVAQWNADQIQSVPVAATAPQSRNHLQYNGVTGQWEPTENVFGLGYVFLVDDPVSVNTSTTLVTKNTLTFTMPSDLPRGGYVRFHMHYMWAYNSTTSDFKADLYLNGIKIGSGHQQEPKDAAGGGGPGQGTNQKYGFTKTLIVNANPGETLQFDIRFGPSSAGVAASMWELFMEAYVVGLF